jgi:hypothetical protein
VVQFVLLIDTIVSHSRHGLWVSNAHLETLLPWLHLSLIDVPVRKWQRE